ASGVYTVSGVPANASFSATAAVSGYTIISSPSYVSVTYNVTTADIVLDAVTYTVSGEVNDGSSPMPGVTVYYVVNGVTGSTTTNVSGVYTVSGVPANASFSATATVSGYTTITTPSYASVTGNITTADIVLDAVTYTISGEVNDGTNPLPGVTVNYVVNGATGSTTTDALGVYTVPNVPANASFSATATVSGYTTISSSSYASVTGNISDADIVLDAKTYTVSGIVEDPFSNPFGDAVIYYRINGIPGWTTSAFDGSYSVTVPMNASFVVTDVVAAGHIAVVPLPSYISVTSDVTGADITLEEKSYTVSGVVIDTDGNLFVGVTVFYEINGVAGSTTTDAFGAYSVPNVPMNASFTATVMISGYAVTAVSYVSVIDDITDADILLVKLFTITITVTSDEGGTFEYMLNNDGIWRTLTADAFGNYVIYNVPKGTQMVIRAIGDAGDDASWTDDKGTRSVGPYVVASLDGDLSLEVAFLSSDKDEGTSVWMFLLFPLIILSLLIFLFWCRRTIVTGIVSVNGEGIAGVTVEYTIDGEPGEPVTTDADGRYVIFVRIDAEVEITSVAKTGHSVNEMMPTMTIEERVTEVNFTASEKK
ncbi:MAG: carboxypeptidase-like regulatory domain-containing protein, partial [Methanomassiliicoccaceae archaeon]|nr:carboxypeptidase-like regulatory domain-containing protein [Methanomassiliicoccaceae archaeon]